MALRLVKSLRYRLPFLPAQTGRRLSPSEDVVDEPPHDYYVVKDYDRNPYYNLLHYAQRPGFKKSFDPYVKAAERRESQWWPNYRYQLFDLGVTWTSLFLIIFFPVQTLLSTIWEVVRRM